MLGKQQALEKRSHQMHVQHVVAMKKNIHDDDCSQIQLLARTCGRPHAVACLRLEIEFRIM